MYCGYIGGILRIYWDNGKENGNYCLGFRVQGHQDQNRQPKSIAVERTLANSKSFVPVSKLHNFSGPDGHNHQRWLNPGC